MICCCPLPNSEGGAVGITGLIVARRSHKDVLFLDAVFERKCCKSRGCVGASNDGGARNATKACDGASSNHKTKRLKEGEGKIQVLLTRQGFGEPSRGAGNEGTGSFNQGLDDNSCVGATAEGVKSDRGRLSNVSQDEYDQDGRPSVSLYSNHDFPIHSYSEALTLCVVGTVVSFYGKTSDKRDRDGRGLIVAQHAWIIKASSNCIGITC